MIRNNSFIAALALSVAVAFSGYDPTTSKVAISSIKPSRIINSLDGFINVDGSVSNTSVPGRNSTATAEMLKPFALDILPYEYRFGMAGKILLASSYPKMIALGEALIFFQVFAVSTICLHPTLPAPAHLATHLQSSPFLTQI
jgi:hypothetical protein